MRGLKEVERVKPSFFRKMQGSYTKEEISVLIDENKGRTDEKTKRNK